MTIKNDCIELANNLIIELELDQEPIRNLIEIDGEFIWFIIENLFKTNLLPKWTNLDCLDETEEFQFILSTLELIFDLDLENVNPAYLTLRKPEYIYLVLNALSLANCFIKTADEQADSSHEDSSNECCSQILSRLSSDCRIVSDRSSELSIDLTELNDEISSQSLESSKIHTTSNEMTKNRSTKSDGDHNLPLKSLEDSPKNLEKITQKVIKPSKNESLSLKKELTDEELTKQLKDLRDNKKLMHNLTFKKEQNFALEISYKILDVLKIQQKTKLIKSNLNRIQFYDLNNRSSSFQLNQIRSLYKINQKLDYQSNSQLKKKRISQTNKKFSKRQSAIRKCSKKQQTKPSLDLNELVNKLTGLTSEQVNEMKAQSDHQKQLINQVKYDLVNAERRLQSQMLTKLEKENQLLEILHKDLNLKQNLSLVAKNRTERKQIKEAKYELRKERASLKKDFDEFYQNNLSNLKNLEHEQEKQLKELTRKKAELFRQDLLEVKREIKEYEMKMKDNQQLLCDNYDNFYSSQSILIQQELNKQKTTQKLNSIQFSSQSVTRHLERSFLNKLYPKFS